MAGLTRWDPFTGLTTMHSQIDDMFNDFFNTNWSGNEQMLPAMDIYTENNDKELVAEVQAPGFSKDDIEVNVHNGMLEIRGQKQEKAEDKKDKRNYMIRESHASFYRSVALPKTADGEHVKAHFENGVLKVRVPMKELPQPKRVAIEAGEKKK